MSQKVLSSWKLHFLKCLSPSTDWIPKKRPNHLHTICQKTLLTHIKCSLALFLFDNTGKIGQNLFFTENLAFFSQFFAISTTSLVLINWSYCFHSNCEKSFLILINCSWSFVMPGSAGNIGQICFFHWKYCLFFSKICVFNNLSGHKKVLLLVIQQR